MGNHTSAQLSGRRAAILGVLLLLFLAAACRSSPAAVTPAAPTLAPPGPTATIPEAPTATDVATATARPTPEGQAALVDLVIDGDTIEVDIGGRIYRVRYIGVDTPERGAPFYGEARSANAELVEGQTVYLVKDVSESDRFGRLLRYVYLSDGTFVNAELMRRGFAQAVSYPPDVAMLDLFLALQQEARQAGRGLWKAVTPATDLPPVRISEIFFDGLVPLVESDEYVEVVNQGDEAVNLGGWQIQAGGPSQSFTFPSVSLPPGGSCRVYTDQLPDEACAFSFGSQQAIWRNGGDCGILLDGSLNEVHRLCYSPADGS